MVQLLALREPKNEYEIFPATNEGVKAALAFIEYGGVLYKLDHYIDKHGDELPRSTRLEVK